MRRPIARTWFAANLLALAAVIAVWIYSNCVYPHCIGAALGWRRIGTESFPICGVYRARNDDQILYIGDLRPDNPFYVTAWLDGPLNSHPRVSLLGFQYMGWHPTQTDRYYAVGVPFWFIASALSLHLWSLRAVFSPRRRDGFCAKCGYDLRCSPARCPECGTPSNPGPARRVS